MILITFSNFFEIFDFDVNSQTFFFFIFKISFYVKDNYIKIEFIIEAIIEKYIIDDIWFK